MIFPNHLLEKMRPEDRAALGPGNQTRTEAQAKFLAGEEDKLQGEIKKYLSLHGLEYINPSMRRRSVLPRGWPDFTFAYRGVPITLEAKTEVGEASSVQREMHMKLRANGWRVLIPRSLADVQALFREIDAEARV